MTLIPTRPSPESGPKRTKGFRVIRWIEKHCVFTNGEWIGKPFVLLPWQKQLILELFQQDGEQRRYRWALVGVPKKNGKTELAAALALYFLIGDEEPAPLVVCAAASDEQADLVFGAAKTMAELSPTLRQVTERWEREILVPSVPGAKLKRVAAASGTNDGQNIHVVICDELHEWQGTKGEAVWNVLTNGTGARRQPMVLQITTAGYDLEGTICGRQYGYAKRVADGEVDDPRYYFRWHQAPEDCDWRDEASWVAANPSYGVTVRREFFIDQLKKTESTFRRYFLNQWVASEETWLPFGVWDACADARVTLDEALPVAVSIDYAVRHDATAVAVAQKQGDQTVVAARIWENPYRPDDPRHDEWHMDLATLAQYLRELRERFPTPAALLPDSDTPAAGPLFLADPYQLRHLIESLQGEGLNVLHVPQTPTRMVPVAQTLHELVLDGKLVHDGDPALARHVANAVMRQTDRGEMLAKPKGAPTKKIDGAVAAAIAVHFVQLPPPETDSDTGPAFASF